MEFIKKRVARGPSADSNFFGENEFSGFTVKLNGNGGILHSAKASTPRSRLKRYKTHKEMKESGIQRKPTFPLRLAAKAGSYTFLLILETLGNQYRRSFCDSC